MLKKIYVKLAQAVQFLNRLGNFTRTGGANMATYLSARSADRSG